MPEIIVADTQSKVDKAGRLLQKKKLSDSTLRLAVSILISASAGLFNSERANDKFSFLSTANHEDSTFKLSLTYFLTNA